MSLLYLTDLPHNLKFMLISESFWCMNPSEDEPRQKMMQFNTGPFHALAQMTSNFSYLYLVEMYMSKIDDTAS